MSGLLPLHSVTNRGLRNEKIDRYRGRRYTSGKLFTRATVETILFRFIPSTHHVIALGILVGRWGRGGIVLRQQRRRGFARDGIGL